MSPRQRLAADLAQGFGLQVRQWALEAGAGPQDAALAAQAAQALSRAVSEGHTALPLDALEDDTPRLREALRASGVAGSPQAPGMHPLLLDDADRLYLHRHFELERRLARRLTRLGDRLTLLAGEAGAQRLLALAQAWSRAPDATVLAAPTAQAAQRLGRVLGAPALTVHRLLGLRPDSSALHDAARPLLAAQVLVDEASRLDLPLAARLLDAVPPTARLVLAGDPASWAAVAPGAVFADLLDAAALAPRAVRLPDEDDAAASTALGRFTQAVRRGDAPAALARLRDPGNGSLQWLPDAHAALAPATREALRAHWQPYADALRRDPRDVAAAWAAFARCRVLCLAREGGRGSVALDALVAGWVREAVGPAAGELGQALVVSRNDPDTGLHTGDLGLLLPDAGGALRAWFRDAGTQPGWRAVPLLRLPPHDGAFALTPRRSQGERPEAAWLVLPQAPQRATGREALLAALPGQRLTLVGSASAVAATVRSTLSRHGGLQARLQEAHAEMATARHKAGPSSG